METLLTESTVSNGLLSLITVWPGKTKGKIQGISPDTAQEWWEFSQEGLEQRKDTMI